MYATEDLLSTFPHILMSLVSATKFHRFACEVVTYCTIKMHSDWLMYKTMWRAQLSLMH